MGRGAGGYTAKEAAYRDSAGHKVTDKGAIWVAERYIEQGYESVFRRKHDPDKGCDLTIKTSDNENIVKNIEVKRVTSSNPSQLAKGLERAKEQIHEGDTVAIYLPNLANGAAGRAFAQKGYSEAFRKGNVIGPIEIWFNDKTKITL